MSGDFGDPAERVGRKVGVDEPEFAFEEAGECGGEQRGGDFVVDGHVGQAEDELAIGLEDGGVGGGGVRGDGDERSVGGEGLQVRDDGAARFVAADTGHHADAAAEAGEVFGDVAGDAAEIGGDRAGVGSAGDEGRGETAVAIDVRAADAGDVHGYSTAFSSTGPNFFRRSRILSPSPTAMICTLS